MKIMVNSEAIAVTLQKICTSSPSVRVSGSVTAGKLAEFHTRCSVPKMPQPIGQPAICTLCQSRVAQPFRGGAGPKARRQSNLLPAGPPHLCYLVSDLDLIPAQRTRDLLYREPAHEHVARQGGGGTGKAEEQPHALQKTCYPPSSSSATVARDCLISSAKPRLQVIASAV